MALQMMKKYAEDFEFKFTGIVNIYEAGSDLKESHGEVFSLTCEDDSKFEKLFLEKLRNPLGAYSSWVEEEGD